MDMRDLIIQTARAIGANPLDLATAMSYESNFNPTVMGGAGGNYGGLIQFGPSERRQYGVDLSSPESAMSSQLGPNGAIAKYMRDRGYKPGMGMADLYSTINAGSPGHYNASDAGNGGAPGTVMDKVSNQMGDDRAKAAGLLYGDVTPAGWDFIKNNPQPGGFSGMPDPNQPGTGWDVGSMPDLKTVNPGALTGPGGMDGPPGAGAAWAFADDKKHKNRLAAAGEQFDAAMSDIKPPRIAQMPQPSGGADLLKLLQNPNALAQALMQRRMG